MANPVQEIEKELKALLEKYLEALKVEEEEIEEQQNEDDLSHDEMAGLDALWNQNEVKQAEAEELLSSIKNPYGFGDDDDEDEEEVEQKKQCCYDCGTHTENEGAGLKLPMNLCGDCEFDRWQTGDLPYDVSKEAVAVFKEKQKSE